MGEADARLSIVPVPAYDPLPDIKRYIVKLLDIALTLLRHVGFEDDDEIDDIEWNAAVDEMRSIVTAEAVDQRLFSYLGRLHFVVASLRETLEGQRERVPPRQYWLEILDQQALAAFRNHERSHGFSAARKLRFPEPGDENRRMNTGDRGGG